MYYHYDDLGNVTDFTDRLGQNVVQYSWDAFGGMFAGVLAPYSKMGITGKEYDPKTGLMFFGSRWYSPVVGQFIMPDTYMGMLDKPQSLNSYAYAWNNPVNNIDPTGHWVDNGDGTYTAESGDTLWSLAEETTGNGSNWTDLGYTGTPENLQIGETVGTPSGGTSSGDTSSGDTSSGYDSGGSGGSSDSGFGGSSGSSGGGSFGGSGSGGGYSGGDDDYVPPPPPPEGGSTPLPDVQNNASGAYLQSSTNGSGIQTLSFTPSSFKNSVDASQTVNSLIVSLPSLQQFTGWTGAGAILGASMMSYGINDLYSGGANLGSLATGQPKANGAILKTTSVDYAPKLVLPSLGDLASGGLRIISKLGGLALGAIGIIGDILVNATPTSDEDWNPDKLTDKPGKIADNLGRTVDEVKRAIEQVKQGTGWRSGTKNRNPDVVVDTDTGEVYPKTSDGGIGDSIGNIHDYLP